MTSACIVAAIASLRVAITTLAPLSAQTQPTQATTACAPANGLNFVCGAQNPEDLVPVPGTRWLVASGMREGAGLKLVDTADKTARLCLPTTSYPLTASNLRTGSGRLGSR